MSCIKCLRKLSSYTQVRRPKHGICKFLPRLMSSESIKDDDFRKYFKKVPVVLKTINRDDFKMNVNVWDWQSKTNDDVQTLVAIHGVPGNSSDFRKLAGHLMFQNCRLVIPDFPGFGGSSLNSEDVYRLDHSTSSKYLMLKAILEALNITDVDILISHSAGTWISYKACVENPYIKSAAFLCPLGGRPHRSLRPYGLLQSVNAKMQNPLIRDKLVKLLPTAYQYVGFKTDQYQTTELQVAFDTVSTANLASVYSLSYKIFQKQLPFFLAFSDDDKVVETNIGEEMLYCLGGSVHNCYYYKKDNEMERFYYTPTALLEEVQNTMKDEDNRRFSRYLRFQTGGHALQHTKADIIAGHIKDLLKYIRTNNL